MKKLIWFGCETTGLDPSTCVVLQAALVVTDPDLNELDAYCVAIHHPDDVLDNVPDHIRDMHTESGVLGLSRASVFDTAYAERALLDVVLAHSNGAKPPLCGNTIGFDRSFLCAHMPVLHDAFHCRSVDVSTLKVLWDVWGLDVYKKPTAGAHDALFDVRQSIAELRYYRRSLPGLLACTASP